MIPMTNATTPVLAVTPGSLVTRPATAFRQQVAYTALDANLAERIGITLAPGETLVESRRTKVRAIAVVDPAVISRPQLGGPSHKVLLHEVLTFAAEVDGRPTVLGRRAQCAFGFAFCRADATVAVTA